MRIFYPYNEKKRTEILIDGYFLSWHTEEKKNSLIIGYIPLVVLPGMFPWIEENISEGIWIIIPRKGLICKISKYFKQ